MKKYLLLMFVFTGCAVLTPFQKSKLIAVYHLIEVANFVEAKNVVEEMIQDKEASQWARTWYARGVVAQDAYAEGIRKNDRKLSELYPNQLNVAYASFERARILDNRGRLERQLAPRYVLLANEFQKIGETHFKAGRFKDALQVFEQALQITRNPLLSVKQDLSLLYNTALAAYEAKEHNKAIEYLSQLNSEKHSPNVAHLLFTMHIEKGDSAAAERVLVRGIEKYEKNEDLVLLLVDLLQAKGETDRAIEILDQEFSKSPDRFVFPYTKGLILQKAERYAEAIESYNKALPMAQKDVMVYINIATCYHNIGVEIEENARYLTNNARVLEERSKTLEAFNSAGQWLDKAYEMKPGNPAIMLRLFQLYRSLGRYDKVRSIQGQIN